MEPRPHERGNAAITLDASAGMFLLQWSHVLTNVETGARPSPPEDAPGRFNGATSSRTWKPTSAPNCSTYLLASMEPRPHERGNEKGWPVYEWCYKGFNGATSSRTWKHTPTGLLSHVQNVASMEPRPHEPGNVIKAEGAGRVERGFNGA